MTNFELIVAKGPRFLAQLISDSKINSLEVLCKKLGVPFEVSEDLRAEMLIEHHEFLLREAKEGS